MCWIDFWLLNQTPCSGLIFDTEYPENIPMALRKVFGIRPLLGNEYVNRNRLKWSAALQTKIQRKIFTYFVKVKRLFPSCVMPRLDHLQPWEQIHATLLTFYHLQPISLQSWEKIFLRNCVKFVPAVPQQLCLALPGSCLSMFSNILSQLCKWGCYVYELWCVIGDGYVFWPWILT